MIVKLLGASAGGGFPQWNCACAGCRAIRSKAFPHGFSGRARTQSQLALSSDGSTWFLLNASPDLRSQIEATPELHPRAGSTVRNTPIGAVALTNADLDHVLGLLLMRESQPLRVYATQSVRKILTEDNSMFRMLAQTHGQVTWQDIVPGKPFELVAADGTQSSLICTPYSIEHQFPIYVDPKRAGQLPPTEAVLALLVEDRATRKKIAYLPGIAAIDEAWLSRLAECDLVFCDGTFWTDDEMQRLAGASRTSKQMGHIPMSGPEGSIELLSRLKRPVKVYTHINNTNPVLNEQGPEHRLAKERGIAVGFDGMEFKL